MSRGRYPFSIPAETVAAVRRRSNRQPQLPGWDPVQARSAGGSRGISVGRHVTPTDRAVLCSAGLDSAVLVADVARSGPVLPLYVSVGFAWERAEWARSRGSWQRAPFEAASLPPLTLTVRHARRLPGVPLGHPGSPPAYDTPDEDVYIVGRNVVPADEGRHHRAPIAGVSRHRDRTARGQPVSRRDARVLRRDGRALSLGLDHPVVIVAPFRISTRRRSSGSGRAWASISRSPFRA